MEKLLEKYIQYIKETEGIDYITFHDSRDVCDIKFTKDEWEILKRISKKVNYPE